MSDYDSFHPLLNAKLTALGLSADEPPSPQMWRKFLEEADDIFAERARGALILDRNFDEMIRHAADGFMIHDTRGRIIDVNEAACEMLGYSREELNSMVVADFEMELKPGAIWDDMTTDQVFTVEGTHLRKDGSTYPVETRVGAFMVDGQKVILGLCRNITERKEAERELQKLNKELEVARDEAVMASRTKSTFLANMSHELRTPLNAVIGYSEFLIEEMEEQGDERFVEDQRRIRKAGHHLLSLINNILDLSKVEAGKVDLEISEFSVSEIVGDIEETIKPLAANNHNEIAVECAGDEITMVSDVTKVRQILLNLLGNACKFTSEGTVSLRAEGVDDCTKVRFSVIDTGVGMTEEELALVFDAFRQADASTTRKFGGTGLGLAITKQYCRLLGGTIDVESTPGEGTTFSVLLPVEFQREEAIEVEGGPSMIRMLDELSSKEDAPVVVVIEDDDSARDLLTRVLENEGYQVAAAPDGRQGLELVRRLKPMAVTLDLLMPEMDGWQTLNALKSDPEVCEIPAILVSMLDEKKRGFALGADHYLTKPIDRRKLVELLRPYALGESRNTCLIVEDHQATRELLDRILRKEGWRVLQAGDGEQGLEVVDREAVDLILLDLMMPEVDGFEFLRRFRSDERFGDVPVVVCTAKELTAAEVASLEADTARIIEKSGRATGEILAEIRRSLESLEGR